MFKNAAAKLIGSTVISQALLSGSSFIVAFVLLRQLGTEAYGYYVLISVGILLLVILQGAFFQTRIIAALTTQKGGDLAVQVGGLIKTRRAVVGAVFILLCLSCLIATVTDYTPPSTAGLFLAGAVSGYLVLWREFSRGLLLAHHQGGPILYGDVTYAVMLVCCSYISTLLPYPTLMAICSIGVTAACSAILMTKFLWESKPWDKDAKAASLREISTIGGWAAYGAGVHWSFSQGYTYIVAALLDVNAVAAIAATRLLLMPVTLLSTGVNQALLPLIARWNARDGLESAAKKVLKVSAVLLIGSLGYVGMAWMLQDWFFLTLMRHDVPLRGQLIVYWSLLVVVMQLRDQLSCLLVAKLKLKQLGFITSFSAFASLVAIFILVPILGPQGALLGVIAGELVNFIGMLAILTKEMRVAKNSKRGTT